MVAKTRLKGSLFMKRCLFVSMIVLISICGCGPAKEKIIKVKPKSVRATINEGHYEVHSFLIDGELPIEGMMRMPGSEIKVSVSFTRNWDVPQDNELMAFVVRETRERDGLAAGSQVTYSELEIACRPGKVTQTVDFKIPLLDSTAANVAEEGGLGRYCRIILAEAKSEIVSHKILIAKE